MKQRILCLIAMLCSVSSFSQGIEWAKGVTWDQVKQKARNENKYIFLDIYATWCAPCKMMDRDIYPLAAVGKVYNEKFISVRVQADRSLKDAQEVKNWYGDAEKIIKEYKVNSFPTFLFLNPEGELVHRANGGFGSEKFIGLANDALNNKGYVSLIASFKKGQYENLNLKELAFSAKYADGDSLAKAIATVYVQQLDTRELLKQNNLFFVFQFGEQDKKWAREVCTSKIELLPLAQLANPQAIRFLIYAAKNDSLAAKATDYWLSRMKDIQVFNKDTLEYVKMFVQKSTDKSFQLLLNNAERVDEIMGKKDWATDVLANIISKEEFFIPTVYPATRAINDRVGKNKLPEPDWKKLAITITKKYGKKYAKWLQFSPKISWYSLMDNKREFTKYLVAEMDRSAGWGLENGMFLNNKCMDVFDYSTSKKELLKAASWMGKYFEKNPKEVETNASGLDTYAILLYKAGQVKESLKWEEKAAQIDPSNTEIGDNLAKMKKGIRIWEKEFDVID